uniref:Uncharacterized protein n=1 Tax=Rhizophora mucronata TaxID=61149 RepID=A0A2P2QKM0_RHIMU
MVWLSLHSGCSFCSFSFG